MAGGLEEIQKDILQVGQEIQKIGSEITVASENVLNVLDDLGDQRVYIGFIEHYKSSLQLQANTLKQLLRKYRSELKSR